MDPAVASYRSLIADVYELAGRSRSTSESLAQIHGHTAAQWHVLSVVSDEPQTVPAIAQRLGLVRQSVQRVVDDLVEHRLVDLIDNPRHRRSRLVEITPRGTTIVTHLFDASTKTRAELLRRAGVGSRDLDRARDVLRAIIDAFDDEATT